MKSTRTSCHCPLFAAAVGLAPRPAAAVDADAAKELMKSQSSATSATPLTRTSRGRR